ncbi:MAG: DUF1963 domain-containing protein [Pseudomonadota bacterium]
MASLAGHGQTAQIDCGALPRAADVPWLPETGTLWFFTDPSLDGYFGGHVEDAQENHVIYRDIDASALPEREPPDGPPWWDSEWGETNRYPNFGPKSLDGRDDVLPTVLAKWPLEFKLMKSYRKDWNQEVSIYDDGETEKPDLSEASDQPRLKRITFTSGEWDGLGLVHAELLRGAWYDAFGLNECRSDPWHRSRPWHRRDETPLTWLALRKYCVETTRRLRSEMDQPDISPEKSELAQQGVKILEAWLTEADKHPTYGVMHPVQRDAFLEALKSMENPGDQVSSLRQISMGMELNDAIHAVLSKQIWHDDCGAAGFDPIVIDCESWKHRPFTRIHHYSRDNLDGPPDSFEYRTTFHRLMGASTTIKYSDPASDGYVLLAEFNYDYGIDLKIWDLKSLTFWIRQQDLEARRFSNVLIATGTGTVDYDMERFKPAEDAYPA